MPHSPPVHNAHKVKENQLKANIDYNKNKRTGQEFYNNRAWRKLRGWYIRNNPLCVHCKTEGIIKAGDVVDHIIEIKNGGEKLNSLNLQTLCHLHHNRKTQEHAEGEGAESL